MEQRQAAFVTWVKAHKRELILAGISITAVTAIIFTAKNRDLIEELWKSLRKTVEAPPLQITTIRGTITQSAELPVQVSAPKNSGGPSTPFIRNLHEGWHASPGKIATAAENGFDLAPGQTWVAPRNMAA